MSSERNNCKFGQNPISTKANGCIYLQDESSDTSNRQYGPQRAWNSTESATSNVTWVLSSLPDNNKGKS